MQEINRYNVFNNIHKGLRAMLLDIQLKVQRTDFSTPGAEALIEELESALYYYDEHADHEDKFILVNILKHERSLTDELKSDHITDHELSAQLRLNINAYKNANTPVEKTLAGKHIFYALNEFIGFNLYHMNKEEVQLLPLLWKHFTDTEILGMEGQILASIDPPALMAQSRWMLRSLSNPELAAWFNGMKHGAPAPVYQLHKQMAGEELPVERLAALCLAD